MALIDDNKLTKARLAAGEAAAHAASAAAAGAAATASAKAKAVEEAKRVAKELEKARKTDDMSKSELFRINMTLPVELDKVLEDLGSEAREQGGFKLAKTLIVRSLIRLARILDVDVSGVKSEEEMLKRLIDAVKIFGKY